MYQADFMAKIWVIDDRIIHSAYFVYELDVLGDYSTRSSEEWAESFVSDMCMDELREDLGGVQGNFHAIFKGQIKGFESGPDSEYDEKLTIFEYQTTPVPKELMDMFKE